MKLVFDATRLGLHRLIESLAPAIQSGAREVVLAFFPTHLEVLGISGDQPLILSTQQGFYTPEHIAAFKAHPEQYKEYAKPPPGSSYMADPSQQQLTPPCTIRYVFSGTKRQTEFTGDSEVILVSLLQPKEMVSILQSLYSQTNQETVGSNGGSSKLYSLFTFTLISLTAEQHTANFGLRLLARQGLDFNGDSTHSLTHVFPLRFYEDSAFFTGREFLCRRTGDLTRQTHISLDPAPSILVLLRRLITMGQQDNVSHISLTYDPKPILLRGNQLSQEGRLVPPSDDTNVETAADQPPPPTQIVHSKTSAIFRLSTPICSSEVQIELNVGLNAPQYWHIHAISNDVNNPDHYTFNLTLESIRVLHITALQATSAKAPRIFLMVSDSIAFASWGDSNCRTRLAFPLAILPEDLYNDQALFDE